MNTYYTVRRPGGENNKVEMLGGKVSEEKQIRRERIRGKKESE